MIKTVANPIYDAGVAKEVISLKLCELLLLILFLSFIVQENLKRKRKVKADEKCGYC